MQKKLVSLQVARGLAAMMVFVMHLFNMAAATTASAWAAKIAQALHYVGHIGVDIFFVLSGVVMCLVLSRAVAYGQTGRGRIAVAADFLARRAVRIYPLFWITLIACLVLPPFQGRIMRLERFCIIRLRFSFFLNRRHILLHGRSCMKCNSTAWQRYCFCSVILQKKLF